MTKAMAMFMINYCNNHRENNRSKPSKYSQEPSSCFEIRLDSNLGNLPKLKYVPPFPNKNNSKLDINGKLDINMLIDTSKITSRKRSSL